MRAHCRDSLRGSPWEGEGARWELPAVRGQRRAPGRLWKSGRDLGLNLGPAAHNLGDLGQVIERSEP